MPRILIIATVMLILAGICLAQVDRDLMSDTWTATDALGRTLPGFKECGPPRKDRYVGIFYFTWLGEHSTSGPWDISKILAENPDNPQWGPLHHFHHWGESELGYYVSSDPYVIRKHCEMLTNAGIDTIILDVTNAFTYTKNYLKICEIYDSIRRAGGNTPQICFITHSSSGKVVQQLYDEFYSRNLYPDLWFRWQGKPLILATPSELSDAMKEFFTVRYSWFAHDPKGWFGDGQDRWTWLDPYPQEAGWHEKGVPEEMSVGIATHPIAGIGRSFHDGKQPDKDHLETDKGLYFAEEFERALKVDPQFIFITGWNEWVAQRFEQKDGSSYFVDQMTQEYSRDAEPMKGGHTDNYYYQMISYIRRFKGVRQPEKASGPKTIRIDGRFADWTLVKPEYRDWAGDTEHRDAQGWNDTLHYTNTTGRNDFVRLKVAYDAQNVYFYAETKDPITPDSDPNWMLLYIDADCNPKTGWNGYDFVIGDGALIDVTGKHASDVTHVAYRARGNKLEMAIPRSGIALSGKPVKLNFHWADNIQKLDDITEFAISGDSAPDRRFDYHFEEK